MDSLKTYRIRIPNWRPARLNAFVGKHWRKMHRLKKNDREIVTVYARQLGIPKATGKRLVSLEIVLTGRQQKADPDAYLKSLADALVACGLLLDDDKDGVEYGDVSYCKDAPGYESTTIVLEDV